VLVLDAVRMVIGKLFQIRGAVELNHKDTAPTNVPAAWMPNTAAARNIADILSKFICSDINKIQAMATLTLSSYPNLLYLI